MRDIEALIERRNATRETGKKVMASLQPETLVAYRWESLPVVGHGMSAMAECTGF